jgi:thiol-disulfide isomerase/thioredoxin
VRQVVLRESTVVKLGSSPNGPMQMNQQTVFELARFDTPLPDSLFTFSPPADAQQVETIAMPGAQPAESELVGKPALPFTLPNLSGKPTSLSAWKGKVVLLDFWASWCGPCRIEMPTIAKLDKELRSKGLVVVGVNVGESRAVASGYLKKNGYTFTALLDGDGKLSERYGARGIPTVVVIDREGNVSSHFVGLRDEAVLRDALAKAGVK